MPKISLDLTGQWEFREYPLSARRMRDLDSADWQQTRVPSSIFTSLIEAGQIKQADIDANPEKFSWVSERPWVYRKIFDAPAELLGCEHIYLVFDGLDTIASIWLNNKLLGKTNNMFIPFRFDVTKILKPGNNSLMVKFEPAVQYAKKLMGRYTQFNESDFSNPHRAYIRKAQYQFGWDFCPALPGCGIWQPVCIEGINKARVADVHIRTIECNQQYADVKIAVKLETLSKGQFLCKLALFNGKDKFDQALAFNPGEDFHSTVIRIEKPHLWWPAGYGQQHLHQLTLKLLSGDEIIDCKQKKFGIRTVKLNRLPDEHGEKFRFEINGQPVFATGANWVPATIYAGSAGSDDYNKLLDAAAEANINMLRVWGGGYYETDEFYELCDRLGIMVWQDFMFACAYYPDRQWFIKDVKKESTIIIRRLRSHPCLVLWCGNNEIDWMHYTGKLGKGKKFYGKTIYHRLLPQLIAELTPGIDYIPTTPLAEKGKFKTSQPLTIHRWDIWSGNQPIRQYLQPPQDIHPFVTEFGLQSLPNMETIKSFCPHEQLRIATFSIEKHNYQLDGNSRLYRYMGDLFGSAKNLEQFIYLSQITQARAAKTYIEYLRAHKPINSGVLFWQLNDCCPAISWSAIDYMKKAKALYYYAKRFFSKLLIAVVPESQNKQIGLPCQSQPTGIIAVNDSNQPLTATLNCRQIDLFGRLLDQVTFPVAISPFSTSALLKLPKQITFPSEPDKSVLYISLERNCERIAENLFLYLPDKYINWPKAEINRHLSQISAEKWRLKLKSNAIAKDVQISTTIPAKFSDNFFDLIPSHEYEIKIDLDQQISLLEPLLQLLSLESVFTVD